MRSLIYEQGKRYEDLKGKAIWNIRELSVGDHVMFGPHTWSFKVTEVDDCPELEDDRIATTIEIVDPFSDRMPSVHPGDGGLAVHMYETGMIRLETDYEVENFRRVETPVGPW